MEHMNESPPQEALLCVITVDTSGSAGTDTREQKVFGAGTVVSRQQFTAAFYPRACHRHIQLEIDSNSGTIDLPLDRIDAPWIVLLKANEVMSDEQWVYLLDILGKHAPAIFEVTVENRLSKEQLNNYQWVVTSDVYRRPAKETATYHTIESRIIHRSCLRGQRIVLQKVTGGSWYCSPDSFQPQSVSSRLELLIGVDHPQYPPLEKLDDFDIFTKGHIHYFSDLQFCMRFAWPPAIYLLIRREHIPGILKALKKGLCTPKSIFYALRFLILNGYFDLAYEMIALIPPDWEEREPMLLQFKGMVYYIKGNIEKAIAAYKKSLDLYKDSTDIESLVNIAKLYLISGKRQMARQLFSRCLESTKEPSEKKSIGRFIESLDSIKNEQARLSLCMIARDEAPYIGQALASVSGCVDEMIVVDTGSIDETRHIAAQHNALIYDFEWNDDFSAARNFALEKASGDYVFFMDADEKLSSFHRLNFMFLRKVLSRQKPTAYQFTIGHNNTETDWMNVNLNPSNFIAEKKDIRLFPNNPGLRYEYRVEETIETAVRQHKIPVAVIAPKDCQLLHQVDNREWRFKRKTSAYHLETNRSFEHVCSAVKHFNALGDEQRTIQWLQYLCDTYHDNPEIWPSNLHLAQLLEKEDPESAGKMYWELFMRFPQIPKVFISLTAFLLRRNRFDQLEKIGCILQKVEFQASDQIEMLYHKTYLALCLLESGCISESIGNIESVLDHDRHFIPAQVARYYVLSKCADATSALLTLEDICELMKLVDVDVGSTENLNDASFMTLSEKIADMLAQQGYLPERAVFLKGSLKLIQKMVVS